MKFKNISLNDIKIARNKITMGDLISIKELREYLNSISQIPKTKGDQIWNAEINAAAIYQLGIMHGKRELRNKKKEGNNFVGGTNG